MMSRESATKKWIRNQIKKAFHEYDRDLLLKYEVSHFLTKCSLGKNEALSIVENEMFRRDGILGVMQLPVEFIENFDERIKRTSYYNTWLRTSNKKCKLAAMCFLKIPPVIKDYYNANAVIISFRDDSKITIGECRRLFLKALEYLKRIKITRYELLGYLINMKKYSFERALIITNVIHSLVDMLDLTYIKINDEIAENLRKLGTYNLWKKMSECYEWENYSPGFILKFDYFNEEENWIDYTAIKRDFRISV